MGTGFLSRTVRFVLAVTVVSSLFCNMNAQDHPKYRTGALETPKEMLDKIPRYKPSATLLATVLPEAVDNSDGLPPVGHQGGQGIGKDFFPHNPPCSFSSQSCRFYKLHHLNIHGHGTR